MYKVSYKLHKSKKPFFDLNINGMYITCLYDTGATVAVWCSSRKLFEKVFPQRILQDSKFSIGGFGGKNRILSDIFRVEGFKLGQIEFPHFPVVTQFDRNFGCKLILGSSLAVNADVSIKRIKEQSINFEPANMVTYDLPVTFTRESWHGRMKACRGIGASSLSDEEIAAWEKEHMAYMQTVPETFKILHYVTILDLRKMELETIITYRDMDRI